MRKGREPEGHCSLAVPINTRLSRMPSSSMTNKGIDAVSCFVRVERPRTTNGKHLFLVKIMRAQNTCIAIPALKKKAARTPWKGEEIPIIKSLGLILRLWKTLDEDSRFLQKPTLLIIFPIFRHEKQRCVAPCVRGGSGRHICRRCFGGRGGVRPIFFSPRAPRPRRWPNISLGPPHKSS